MINVVECSFSPAEADEIFHGGDEIFFGHRPLGERDVQAHFLVELVASDTTQVILFRIEEESFEQSPRIGDGWWIARPKATVDILEGFFFVVCGIFLQGLDHGVIELGVDHLDGLDSEGDDLADGGFSKRFEGSGYGNFAVADIGDQDEAGDFFFFEAFG